MSSTARIHGVNKPIPAPIEHYENFPVASWLCPPRLRPPIAAIYHFARTADDLADEVVQALVGAGLALVGSPTAHREAETAKAHRG